ncbi:hypothetical protein DQF64_08075 [Moraxella bovis]|nr:hypothetical protein DQF64_08075 [Moraxella bovis]
MLFWGLVGVPWRSVKPQLIEVMQIARDAWKRTLDNLPMAQMRKEILIKHWAMLDDDFRMV